MSSERSLGITAGLLAALLSCSAHADGLGYTYLDVDYFHIMPDSTYVDSHPAYGVFGSYALPADLVLSGSYLHSSSYNANKFSPAFGDETDNDAQLGLGYRIHLSDRVDLVPGLDYVSNHAGFSGPLSPLSIDGKGYDLNLTPRFLVTDALELNLSVDHFRVHYTENFNFRPPYNDIGNGESVGAVYSFTPGFALGGDYGRSTSNGLTSKAYDLFARFYF